MSLGVLVGRFGQFVRTRHDAPAEDAAPDTAFPADLARLREAVAHHVIPLALLSRADGDFAQSERDAIMAHCLTLLGDGASEQDRAALQDYIANARPSLMQLDPALTRLEHDSPAAIAAMLAAAEAVMNADGQCDPAEAKLIAEMRAELGG